MWIAVLVVLVVAAQTVIAWRAQPADQAGQAFLSIWRSGPWAKQFYLDFAGLEVVLALWMTQHAMATDSWWVLVPCLLTMPVTGAMSAGLYWIIAVV